MNKNAEHTTIEWFGFEINHSQSIFLFILAFTGALNIPLGILKELNKLLAVIFLSLPLDDFKEPIITLLEYIVFFNLCLYTIRIVLKHKQNSAFKRNLSQDQVTNWFGFRINHSQSMFLFTISLVGLIAIIFSYLHGFDAFSPSYFFRELYTVPLNDYLSPYGNLVLQRYAFNFIHLVIFLISLYTLIKTRYIRANLSVKSLNKNYQLVIFIISLAIVIFLLPRLFCHIVLFTALGPLVGIDPIGSIETTNLQFTDFVIVTLIVFVCANIISFSIKRVPHPKEVNKKLKFKSPKVFLITLSISSFVFLIFFSQSLITIFSINVVIYGFFPELLYNLFILLLMSIPFLILFSYTTRTYKMEEYLGIFESTVNKKWLRCIIKRKSYIIILFWISISQLVYLIIRGHLLIPELIPVISLQISLSSLYYIFDVYLFILVGLEALFCVYNIIKLYPSQK